MNKPLRFLPSVRIRLHEGRFQIEGLGAWYSYWRDPYYLLLTIPWTGFLALISLLYVLTNAVFGLIYLAGGDGIKNAQPHSFLDAFFFSVQTLSTVGYGYLYPDNLYANLVATIELLVGLLGVAVFTGLAFARFARPTARVLFSRVAVITPYEGVPTLMFRTANQRRNQILEAQLRVSLMRDEVSAEGHFMRRLYELKLLRSHSPSFSLGWSVMHPINENSPLYGMTPEALASSQTMLIVSLTGIDETVVQSVHARHTYAAADILWNQRFVDIFHITPDGHRLINYALFHEVTSI
ncbi:MAG: ion channel [Chamaesiphon sp.]